MMQHVAGLLLICIWWGFSAWNASYSKLIMKAVDGPACVGLTAFASNIFGLILLWFLHFVSLLLPKAVPDAWTQREGVLDVWRVPLWLSCAHAIGLYASYMSFVGASVSFIQTAKALEPLLALLLSSLWLFKKPSFQTAAAVIMAVAGAVFVFLEDTSYSFEALVWIIVSSIAMQSRNVQMKVKQGKSEGNHQALEEGIQDVKENDETTPEPAKFSPALDGFLTFIKTSAGAFFATAPMAVLDILRTQPDASEDTGSHGSEAMCKPEPVLMAGFTHFVYNLASFGVLACVHPITHSLANIAKRAVVISYAVIILGEHVAPHAMLGLLFVFLGAGLYAHSTKKQKSGASRVMMNVGHADHAS